jgi:hypothetical protein
MLHFYAALAEKDRRQISSAPELPLAARKKPGTKLGNPRNASDAALAGRQTQAEAAAVRRDRPSDDRLV